MSPELRRSPRVIHVALAPDLPIVVAGVTAALQSAGPDILVVDLPSGATPQRPVDVVLYDPQTCRPPARSTGEPVARPLLVALSWTVRSDTVAEARQQGAVRYLSKELGAAELVAAIRDLPAGPRTPYVVGPRPAGSRLRRRDGLTERELEILAMITEGWSNEEIAGRLFLSINSVKTYIRTAYRKIGATKRPQAVLWGVENGFAPQPGTLRP